MGGSPRFSGQRVLKVRLTPAAEADVRGIDAWYREQGEGLVPKFRRALNATIERVALNPQAYPKVYAEMRRALLRRFPYAVFYVIGDEEVGVLGVFHGRRDPNVWRARLDV